MIDFNEYKGTELESVSDYIETLKGTFDHGEINRDEYLEILEDVKRTELVQLECADIKLKSNLIKGIDALLKVI